MNGLLTANEVASILKIHVNTVYYYLEKGRLKGHRVIGNRWRIKSFDLDRFINGQDAGQRQAESNDNDKSRI